MISGVVVFTHDGTTVSSNGTIYPSYTAVDKYTFANTDSSVKYVIQPIQYKVVYNSNYPTGTNTTVEATHTWNCTNNQINATASFTKGGTGVNYSKTHTFSCSGYKFLGWSTSANNVVSYKPSQGVISNSDTTVNYITSGKDGDVYNLYAIWAPVNYTLSVEYVSQVDRELIGTPDGFCVKVGSTTLGKDDNESKDFISVDLSKTGKYGKNNVSSTYANGVLSIKTTTANDPYLSVDIETPANYDMMTYKYMAITYKLSAGIQAGKIYFKSSSMAGFGGNTNTAEDIASCWPGWISDGEYHTVVFNMTDITHFYYVDKNLHSLRLPGGNVANAVLDISSIKFYKTPATIWGESTVTEDKVVDSTALKTQGGYTFSHVINPSTAVNVISAQQADYDFVMDLTDAYIFFYDNDRVAYTSTAYSNSGWNGEFGSPVSVNVNGVTQLGYNVTKYIKNHTFDMAEANFKMPSGHVKLVFVCDYVNYEVKVFSYTADTSYTTITDTSLVNNATSISKAFPEATLTISSSKNDGIVGRYGSTVALNVTGIASGKKFLGWYERNADLTTTGTFAYGKLVSADAAFTLSTNLHKDMKLVAVFATTTANETTFNFRNVSGQIIQTLVGTKGSYIPVSNITAVPFKTGSAFSGWEFLKHADKSKVELKPFDRLCESFSVNCLL